MTGQITLFDEIEQEERDRKQKRAIREGYRKWLTAPELTPCGPDAHIDYNTYSGIIHRCDDMPDGVYFWVNELWRIHGGQFWVMAHKSEPEGEQMDVCPYCKADLCHGEGQRYLRKAAGYVFSEDSYRKYYGLDEIDELERRCAV